MLSPSARMGGMSINSCAEQGGGTSGFPSPRVLRAPQVIPAAYPAVSSGIICQHTYRRVQLCLMLSLLLVPLVLLLLLLLVLLLLVLLLVLLVLPSCSLLLLICQHTCSSFCNSSGLAPPHQRCKSSADGIGTPGFPAVNSLRYYSLMLIL